jgi:putative heme degradation protein
MAKTDSSDQKINAIGNTVSMVYDDVSTLHDQIANIKSQYKYKDQHLENEIQRAMDLYDQEFQALYEKYEPIFQKLDAFEKLLESYTTESGLKIYHLKGQSKTGIKIE